MVPVPEIVPAVAKLPPVTVPVAVTNPPVKIFPPVTLPLVLVSPPVYKLPPVTLPVAVTNPAVETLPPVMLPVPDISPPVYKLPPVTVPVTLRLVPVAAPMLGVVNVAPDGMYSSLLPLMPIVLAPEVSILTLNCVPFKLRALPAVY